MNTFKLQAARIFIGLNALLLIISFGQRSVAKLIRMQGGELSENPIYVLFRYSNMLMLPIAALCLVFGIIVLSSLKTIWRESGSTTHVLLTLSFILSLFYVGGMALFIYALSMMQ